MKTHLLGLVLFIFKHNRMYSVKSSKTDSNEELSENAVKNFPHPITQPKQVQTSLSHKSIGIPPDTPNNRQDTRNDWSKLTDKGSSKTRTPAEIYESLRNTRNRLSSRRELLNYYSKAIHSLDFNVHANDPHLLQIWLDYIELQRKMNAESATVSKFYQKMHSLGIGKRLGQFYISWASFLDDTGSVDAAVKVLLAGNESVGTGKEKVEKKLQEFEKKLRDKACNQKANFGGPCSTPNVPEKENRMPAPNAENLKSSFHGQKNFKRIGNLGLPRRMIDGKEVVPDIPPESSSGKSSPNNHRGLANSKSKSLSDALPTPPPQSKNVDNHADTSKAAQEYGDELAESMMEASMCNPEDGSKPKQDPKPQGTRENESKDRVNIKSKPKELYKSEKALPNFQSNNTSHPNPSSRRAHLSVNGNIYAKLELLGRGGSSKVFKVLASDGKLFALKRVHLKGVDPVSLSGYLNEISLLKRLEKCDRIIHIYDSEVNEKEGYLHMVMECGEIDLAHVLQKQKGTSVNLNFVRVYWEQMLQAVQAIHDERVVHSDLKPANFLFVKGALKLIDFGIAKAIQNDTTNIHREHQVGTVNYMSPEAIIDTNSAKDNSRPQCMKLGRPSDVWSLGCILYQMVYGKTPFHDLPMIPKLQRIIDPNGVIAYPLVDNPYLLEVMKSCLQRDPKKRMTIPELLQHPFLNPDAIMSKFVQNPPTELVESIVEKIITALKENSNLQKEELVQVCIN